MLITFKENKYKISTILYIAAVMCLVIFLFTGKGIMDLGRFSENMFYNYIGFMSVGMGIFSSSVLMVLGRSFKSE